MSSDANNVATNPRRLAVSTLAPWKVAFGYVGLTAINVGVTSALVGFEDWSRWQYLGCWLLLMLLSAVIVWLVFRYHSGQRSTAKDTSRLGDIEYQAMFASHPTPMIFFHRNSLGVVQANQAALDLYGYTSAQFRDLSIRDLYASEGLGLSAPAQRSQTILVDQLVGVRRHVSKSGRVFEAEIHHRPASITEASYDLLVAQPKDALPSLGQTFEDLAQRFQAQTEDGFMLNWIADRHGAQLKLFPDIRGELGLSRESILSFNRFLVAVHEGDREGVERAWSHARRSGETVHQYRLRRSKDGRYRSILERIVCVYDPHEGTHKLAGFCIEFSASILLRRRKDQALYERMIDNSPDGVVIVRQEIIEFANPSARVLFGSKLDEKAVLKGLNVRILFNPEDRGREVDRLNALQHRMGEESRFRHVRLIRLNGTEFEAELSELILDGPEGVAIQLLIRDISNAVTMRKELQNANQRLQYLSQSLIEVQETERRQLARDLHDDIGQQLTGMKLQMQRLANRSETEEQKRVAEDLALRVDETLTKVRSLSLALHPLQLETLGLEAAVRWHLSQFFADPSPHWEVEVSGNLEMVPPYQAVAAFRLIQEAVNNVARHANASKLKIRLLRESGHLQIDIIDDGKGFDVTRAKSKASSLGLTSMQERVAALNGSLQIASLPGLGTRISARVTEGSQPSVERRYRGT